MDAESEHRMVRSGSRQYLTFRPRVKTLSADHIQCTDLWHTCGVGRDGSVGTATHCGLDGRILVGGEIFPTRPDRPWAPPSLLYNGYRVFPGGKAAGAWRWPPISQLSFEVEEGIEFHFFSPSGLFWPVLGWPLPFLFILKFMGYISVYVTDVTPESEIEPAYFPKTDSHIENWYTTVWRAILKFSHIENWYTTKYEGRSWNLAILKTGTRRSMKGDLEIFLFLACKKYFLANSVWIYFCLSGMPLALQQEWLRTPVKCAAISTLFRLSFGRSVYRHVVDEDPRLQYGAVSLGA